MAYTRAPHPLTEAKEDDIESKSSSLGALPDYGSDKDVASKEKLPSLDQATTLHEGEQRFKQLGWVKMTVCLIVEAIALGSLSIPSAFAKVGMVGGVLLTVGIGFIAIYTSYVVGQVKLRHTSVAHYADAVGLIWGKFGYELAGVMFVINLTLLVGSHALTGTIAWINIVQSPGVCAVVFSLVSAIILFLLALPPTFSEFAILGYIDFASILIAIVITIISTGIHASNKDGGFSSIDWHVWAPPGVTLADGFLATTNIIFAYSFAICQFSFMDEMHTPSDYVKSIWALGLIEIFIYTTVGALIYAFVGTDVSSPAILSAGGVVSRIAFGVALPVIFISGSINGTVVGRYIMNRAFPHSSIRYINNVRGWLVWIVLIATITIIGWIIAEAIPFFNALLGLMSSLFISGFTFYFPALFWFGLVKEGKWNSSTKNIVLSVVNAAVFAIGMAVLGLGTYASVEDILTQYSSGKVRGSFTCAQAGYT